MAEVMSNDDVARILAEAQAAVNALQDTTDSAAPAARPAPAPGPAPAAAKPKPPSKPAAKPPTPVAVRPAPSPVAALADDLEAAAPLDLPELGHAEKAPGNIDLLGDVDLHVAIELGRTEMLVEDVLRLSSGSVVELDKLAGDPVDVFVNGRLIARGEVLVLNDNFCIRISEIVANLQEQAEAAAEGVAA